jgi:RNA polymerase sigma-70 factor, ECF subfamily
MWRDRQPSARRLPEPAAASDEAQLIARSRDGDVAAFNCLVERYQEAAYGLAFRLLGSAESAADVTQDAFISAFRAMSAFRGSAFRPWLLRIVSNGCYDVFRQRGRHPSISLDAMLSPIEDGEPIHALSVVPTEQQWDPERVALTGELIELIRAALLELAPEQRLAIVLSDVQGLSYEEVAEVMQTSLGTVKSRISRGRARLRDLLREHGEHFPAPERHASDREE